MFDIGWSEMAVILLVALVVIGPRDLPRVARSMGKWVAKGRAMAREFQGALEDMAREAELDKVKDEIEKAGRTNLGKSIEKTIDPTGELGQAFDPKAKSQPKASKEPAATAIAKDEAASAGAPAAAKQRPAPAEPAAAKKATAAANKPAAAKKKATPASRRPAAAKKEGGSAVDNGAGKEAAGGAAATPDPAPDSGRPAGAQEEGSRPRAQAPERETVPADPS